MKQVTFFIVAVMAICSCNNSTDTTKVTAEQTKMKLLKQAGFDKMDKAFTYDYTEHAGTVTATLNLVPEGEPVILTGSDTAKGKLLNVFMTSDGHQYGTTLRKRGGSYVTVIVSIDGNVFEEHIYQTGDNTGTGTPPTLPCLDDCSESCIQSCIDYYKRSVFPGLQDSANRTCKTIYYRFMCPLGARNCHADMLHVFVPENKTCLLRIDQPEYITAKLLATGLIIKNQEMQK